MYGYVNPAAQTSPSANRDLGHAFWQRLTLDKTSNLRYLEIRLGAAETE